jgi:hypothetical protein
VRENRNWIGIGLRLQKGKPGWVGQAVYWSTNYSTFFSRETMRTLKVKRRKKLRSATFSLKKWVSVFCLIHGLSALQGYQ